MTSWLLDGTKIWRMILILFSRIALLWIIISWLDIMITDPDYNNTSSYLIRPCDVRMATVGCNFELVLYTYIYICISSYDITMYSYLLLFINIVYSSLDLLYHYIFFSYSLFVYWRVIYNIVLYYLNTVRILAILVASLDLLCLAF